MKSKSHSTRRACCMFCFVFVCALSSCLLRVIFLVCVCVLFGLLCCFFLVSCVLFLRVCFVCFFFCVCVSLFLCAVSFLCALFVGRCLSFASFCRKEKTWMLIVYHSAVLLCVLHFQVPFPFLLSTTTKADLQVEACFLLISNLELSVIHLRASICAFQSPFASKLRAQIRISIRAIYVPPSGLRNLRISIWAVKSTFPSTS